MAKTIQLWRFQGVFWAENVVSRELVQGMAAKLLDRGTIRVVGTELSVDIRVAAEDRTSARMAAFRLVHHWAVEVLERPVRLHWAWAEISDKPS